MRRREALKLGAATAAAIAGCAERDEPPQPTTTSERPSSGIPASSRLQGYAGRFDSVVDASSVRADEGGGRPLNAFFEDVAGDHTLIFLPRGRYEIEEGWSFPAFENFGIVGDDATIVPPEGYDDGFFVVGTPEKASGFLIDGITFDFSAEQTGGRPLNVKVRDQLEVRNVSVVGTLDVDAQMIRVDVTSPSGTGLVEHLSLPDGALHETGAYGCFVGETNRGDITFRDCHIAGFPNNGLYAEPPEGRMRVIGGRYENNNVANVRVSGGGLIRGVHVRCDTPLDEFVNVRGIRLRQGTGSVVENSVVELLDVTGSDGAIVVSSEMNEATIRNTHVRIDQDDVAGILAKPPSTNDGRQSIRCENVCIEGAATHNAAILVENRDGCIFDQLQIRQTGQDRDGVELIRSRDNVLRNSRISVTGEPIALVDSTVDTANVWTNDQPEDSTLDCHTS